MGAKKRGVAIPTALFFVMVLFFIASVIVTEAVMNIRLGGQGALERQQFYAARGLANRAVAELGRDPNWSGYTAAAPLKEGPLELEVEIIEEAGVDLVHVNARAYPAGRPGQAVTVSKSLHKRSKIDPRTWAIAPVPGPGAPESIFFRGEDDADWTLIPPTPRQWYDLTGTLQSAPGYASNLFSFHPGTENDVYALYYPVLDRAGPISDIARESLEAQFANRTNRSATLPLLELVDVFGGFGPLLAAFQGVSVMHYNGNAWEALPPLPGARYQNGVPVKTGDHVIPGLVANTDVSEERFHVSVITPEADFLYQYDLADGLNGSWTVLDPPSNTFYGPDGIVVPGNGPASHIFSSAEDSFGGLYAHTGKPALGHAVQRRDPDTGEWTLLPPVPNQYYDSSGTLVDDGGAAVSVADLHVGFQDEVYISHIRSVPELVGNDTTFVLRNGRWQPVAQPHLYSFDAQGEQTELPELAVNIDSTGMNAEGHLLLHARVLGQPDVNYRYLDGRLVEVYEPLPRSYHDSNGNPHQEPGFFDLELQVGGGGNQVNGFFRYQPLGDY